MWIIETTEVLDIIYYRLNVVQRLNFVQILMQYGKFKEEILPSEHKYLRSSIAQYFVNKKLCQ